MTDTPTPPPAFKPVDDPASLFVRQPNEKQKALWDTFVAEYVKDWQPVSAAMRVGFNLSYATEYAKMFLSEPYVQRAISRHELTPSGEDVESETVRLKRQIEQTLLKAMGSGDPKVATAAAMGLAKLRGLDQMEDKSADQIEKLVNAFADLAKNVPD